MLDQESFKHMLGQESLPRNPLQLFNWTCTGWLGRIQSLVVGHVNVEAMSGDW